MLHYPFSVEEAFQLADNFLDGLDAFLRHLDRARKAIVTGKSVGAAGRTLELLEEQTIRCNFARRIYLDLLAEMQVKLTAALRSQPHDTLNHLAAMIERGEIAPFVLPREGG